MLKKPENEGSKPQKSTKTPILCSKSPKTGVPDPNKAQKTRFCAREERKLASGSITSEKLIVNVAFLQIIAHANVPWSCLEEGFVCAMNCRNGTPSQVAVVSGTQHLHTGTPAKRQPYHPSCSCAPARRQPHSAEMRRWRRQSVQMGRKICSV